MRVSRITKFRVVIQKVISISPSLAADARGPIARVSAYVRKPIRAVTHTSPRRVAEQSSGARSRRWRHIEGDAGGRRRARPRWGAAISCSGASRVRARTGDACDRPRASDGHRTGNETCEARRRDGAMMGDDRTRWRHARRLRGGADDGEEGDVHVERARVVDGDAARGEGREG